jgi:enamine deaminase RidA (YjgF/YER057c/UK114 family)
VAARQRLATEGEILDKRRSIEVEGLHHGGNPIPTASRIGPFVASGGIFGQDPRTGTIPSGVEEQCAVMFANIRRIVEAAGGTPEDILQVNVWLKDISNRPHVNKEWVAMFPNPESRPVRHTEVYRDLPEGRDVLCQFLAVLQ